MQCVKFVMGLIPTSVLKKSLIFVEIRIFNEFYSVKLFSFFITDFILRFCYKLTIKLNS